MPHINNMSMCAFLTGFNDSFAHIRGQVLLLEPLPLINKVFPLIQFVNIVERLVMWLKNALNSHGSPARFTVKILGRHTLQVEYNWHDWASKWPISLSAETFTAIFTYTPSFSCWTSTYSFVACKACTSIFSVLHIFSVHQHPSSMTSWYQQPSLLLFPSLSPMTIFL